MKIPTLPLALSLALVPALVLGFTAPLRAQEDPGTQPDAQRAHQPEPDAPPLVQAADLKTYYFTPQHVRSTELRKLAERLYGRVLYVADHGGYNAPPVENLQQLGDTLVIYDTADYAQLLGEALHNMDQAMAVADGDDAGHAASSNMETAIATWRPRHIGLNVSSAALASFRREALVFDERGNASRVPNVSIVGELGQLILRDTPDQVQAMLDMLQSIDVPEQQMYVTCLVIRGQHAPSTDPTPIPEELSTNLSKLVPYEHFEMLTMGVLRASAMADNLELSMDGNYKIQLVNQGYDAETKSLTALCGFGGPGGQRIETRTTIHAGEYTVLGATGFEPLFAVLKIEPIDK
jgi:hypothetical protein